MPCHDLVSLDASTFEKDGSGSLITSIEQFGQDGYVSVANSTISPVAGKALFGVSKSRYPRYETLYQVLCKS